ncbi:site-specific integrase [Mesorhizobium sp. C120A]|uniref:tyrosine-type recombinase/integrase n=1 Tax=unclassified Mesorhizobium TaxID=325217 RepID=UPI000421FFDC|nr:MULTISPECIES: site-specific integrase [unclassified Mesorhizobium]WJI43746.1 site-specific integrase [Mesorhizobium sp. C120A]
MSVYKRPGQSEYSFDFRYRRQRFSGPTGCTSRREAEKVEADELARVKGLQFDASKPLAFKAAAAQYWNEVGQFHRNHVDTLRALEWLQDHIGAGTMISTINDATVAKAVAKRRGEDVSAATVNRSVCEPLRALLRRARRTWKQTVEDIEWKDHFLKEPQERVREATADEESKLLAAIRGDYAPALRFALLSGCRRAEIVGLQWKDVDFFNREFRVTGKGDKTRTVPMTKAIYALLWDLKDHHKMAVFTYVVKRPRAGMVKGTREPITMEGFKTEWRWTKGRAKVKDYRFHDNRHTAATRLVRATGNLKAAQKLLGHTELATTSRYSHLTKDDLRAAMEASDAAQAVETKAAPATVENKK